MPTDCVTTACKRCDRIDEELTDWSLGGVAVVAVCAECAAALDRAAAAHVRRFIPRKSSLLQIGGEHYRQGTIQPIEFAFANDLRFAEGNVVKYVTRWRYKGGRKDLEKARHYLDLLLEFEAPDGRKEPTE